MNTAVKEIEKAMRDAFKLPVSVKIYSHENYLKLLNAITHTPFPPLESNRE